MSRDTAVVFGGTSGIGAAVVRLLHAQGLEVGAYGLDPTAPHKAGLELIMEERDPDLWRRSFDVRDLQALKDVLSVDAPRYVVYSVGVTGLDWIRDMVPGDAENMATLNAYAFLDVMAALQTIYPPDGRAISVVAVTSDAAWRPMRASAAYCASKAALEMCVKVAARETTDKGWRVNAVAPGKVEGTPLTEKVDAEVLRVRGWDAETADTYELSQSPLGRHLNVEEVAAAIVAVLLCPSPGWTGSVIAVNGGR